MRFAGIDKNDISDSTTGVALSFWTQGCPFHCKNCHNPQTWSEDGGYELPDDYKERVLEMLDENNIFRDLSILGGEPFYKDNKKIVFDLLKKVRESRPATKVYIWSGYTLNELLSGEANERPEDNNLVLGILSMVDFLIDGLYVEELHDRNLKLRGSSNQNIYQNTKSGVSLLDRDTIISSYKLIENEENI